MKIIKVNKSNNVMWYIGNDGIIELLSTEDDYNMMYTICRLHEQKILGDVMAFALKNVVTTSALRMICQLYYFLMLNDIGTSQADEEQAWRISRAVLGDAACDILRVNRCNTNI